MRHVIATSACSLNCTRRRVMQAERDYLCEKGRSLVPHLLFCSDKACERKFATIICDRERKLL